MPARSGGEVDLEAALRRRRMCRSFSDAPVSPGDVDAVVEAAFGAPAAGNTWALDVVVLDEPEAVAGYWATALPDGAAGFAWPGLLRAPVLLVPVIEPDAYLRRYRRADKAASGLGEDTGAWGVPYWWVDAGAAVMAMLLVAESRRLGALFFGQFDHEPALARHLGIPTGRRAVGTLALGHPDGGRSTSRSGAAGRPPARDFRHHGRW